MTDGDLVWGADVGGTSTRVGIADHTGRVLAVVQAGPGNPHTVGVATSASRVRAAAEHARNLADPTAERPLVGGVVGLAGVSAIDPADYAARVRPAGAPDPLVLVDLAVAYASGTPASHGVVALAGTGAGAMELADGLVLGRSDAWGWLLGDEGSAQWVGRELVRHALARLGRPNLPADDLTTALLARLGLAAPGDGELGADALLRRVYLDPPRALAGLAPVVSATGGPAAVAILDAAADRVAGHADRVLAGRSSLPVVLSGALAARGGPLHDRLRARLDGHRVSSAADGVAGACWLALSAATPQVEAVHGRLLTTVGDAARELLPD